MLSDYGATHSTANQLNSGLDFEPWPGLTYSPAAVEAALDRGGSSQIDLFSYTTPRQGVERRDIDSGQSGDQDALITKVAAAQPHTVAVLETGGPVLTSWVRTCRRCWDVTSNSWRIASGCYSVMIGSSSQAIHQTRTTRRRPFGSQHPSCPVTSRQRAVNKILFTTP